MLPNARLLSVAGGDRRIDGLMPVPYEIWTMRSGHTRLRRCHRDHIFSRQCERKAGALSRLLRRITMRARASLSRFPPAGVRPHFRGHSQRTSPQLKGTGTRRDAAAYLGEFLMRPGIPPSKRTNLMKKPACVAFSNDIFATTER